MTIHHLFQKIDRVMRNRPDALRWRVTMSETQVEVFRRPVLTSAVTLGALGLTDAPMPIPRCIVQLQLVDSSNVAISAIWNGIQYTDPIPLAVQRTVWLCTIYADAEPGS
ncbi:MAG: hypothetical protein DWI54_07850 [Chloroflexi bacterium]|nr:MAG: hypothetical protein DWI54_07850 [Chloroflexota bacterium]RLT34094.1 MAG: hypothetical protein DWI55_00720 [Chloroflexota bacterium]